MPELYKNITDDELNFLKRNDPLKAEWLERRIKELEQQDICRDEQTILCELYKAFDERAKIERN